MNIIELQGFLDRLSHLSLLNIVLFSVEIVISNYVAITFSQLKSKLVKSKHLCEELYKSNSPLKMIRVAILS